MNAPIPIDYKAPPGWGDDPLSHFQSVGIQNEFATFANAPSWHKVQSAIAADLAKCSDYAITNVLKADDPSALLLFMTAHNQFLASARLAASGQCLPAYPTGRAAMESALYGWYLARNPGAAKRWHDKPTDRAALKAWNAEFKFSALTSALSKTSEDAAKWAKYLHQTSIDFGAHPNKEALYSNMAHKRGADGSSTLEMTFLHTWRAFSVSTTKFVIETGMFAISLFARAFPDAERANGFLAAAAGHATALHTLVAETAQFVEDDMKRSNDGQ
jgi:hypothetical protein